MSCTVTVRRAVGDTLSALALAIQQNGVPVDLTGKVVKLEMFDSEGNTIIAAPSGATSNVNVSDAPNGEIEYDFDTAEVDTAGDFYIFIPICDVAGVECDSYPDEENGILLVLYAKSQDRTVVDPSISEIDIIEAAKAPRRTRTVEGTVEERSINELIKADQYNAAKDALDAVPWGIRIAKSKPPSTLS